MTKVFLPFLLVLIFASSVFSQKVTISIAAPRSLNDRRAILLTREKGFAAVVHSIQLGFDTTHLQMDKNLLPDLYQFQISQMKGSLTFFFESGTQIRLDTANLSSSLVTHSKSNVEWRMFQDNIQLPSEKRSNSYLLAEGRARKKNQIDSAAYWLNLQNIENQDLIEKTSAFIAANPRSYVSLYLLKNNWFALKNLGLFEKLDPMLAHHRNYRFLKERSKGLARN
ncbi:hypothetical protein [Dyadobacter luticola]|uniref:DUF4369 domain-containing protein n=1 Tax=Dyadobacter luticola TaxID=1979387 RepID=A0A5R9KT82_9BACT|nr:hypothetical protein [Dyadobacter luticola]TLU99481.1 hypothetical protein FEN17_23270 [Dyadobacter luticola]